MAIFYSNMEPLSQYSPVKLHCSSTVQLEFLLKTLNIQYCGLSLIGKGDCYRPAVINFMLMLFRDVIKF